MKYFGTLFFAAIMIWTWTLIHQFEDISFETHANLQIKLSELIKETVASKRPSFEGFQILKLWTEKIEKNKIKASFVYKFSEKSQTSETESADKTESIVSGNAILSRVSNITEDVDQWRLDKVETTNNEVAFTSGVVIGPNLSIEPTPSESPIQVEAPATPATVPATAPKTAPDAPAGH